MLPQPLSHWQLEPLEQADPAAGRVVGHTGGGGGDVQVPG